MTMRRPVTMTMPTIAALALLAALPMSSASAQDLQAGAALANQHCARCHSIDAGGASPLPMAPPFREIASRYSVWSLQEALAEGIMTGHESMPEFKFEPKQIDDLLSFMDTFTPSRSRTRK